MANGLFSLFKSLGYTPYIRVTSDDLSTRVSKKLQQLFYQGESDSDDSEPKRLDRPLLIILDRNIDIHTMFYHSWTYLSLIQDIFGIRNNQFIF